MRQRKIVCPAVRDVYAEAEVAAEAKLATLPHQNRVTNSCPRQAFSLSAAKSYLAYMVNVSRGDHLEDPRPGDEVNVSSLKYRQ